MSITASKHRGRKSTSRPIKLKCSKCGYEWNYYGKRDRYGTNCPVCQSWVTIPPHLRKLPPKPKQAKKKQRTLSKPGVTLQCPKCGYRWVYTGKYVKDIVAGKRIYFMISCPRCLYRISTP